MMRLLLLILAIRASGYGDSLHLKVVLDTNSPAEYNRWVWQHRRECPDFSRVYITCDSWARHGKFERPAVSFWTDSGPLLMHRILPDSQLAPSHVVAMGPILDISPNTGQLTVLSGRDSFATYDRSGTRLFTDPSRPAGLTSGRWLTYRPYPIKQELLDDSGRVLCTIPSPGQRLYADDSVFMLRNIEGAAVLFDRDGHELWRSRRLVSHSAFAVAHGASAVAVSTADSLVIFNPPDVKSVSIRHDKDWGLFRSPTMAWSVDAKLLAVYQGSSTAWDSGRVFVLNTHGRIVRPARKMRLYNVRSLQWMGDALLLPALNVDFSHTDPRAIYAKTLDSCVVSAIPPRGVVERATLHGKFKIYGSWAASGGHLAYTTGEHYMVAECRRGRQPSRSGSR